MEYETIVHNVTTLLDREESDIEANQAEMDKAQALLDRRRKALRRKRNSFSKMVEGWKTLDVEVVSGKPSRSDTSGDDEDQDDDRREPADGESAA
jgi:hypothetical protein